MTSTTNRGVTTQVHEFTFGRSYGFPFQTVHSKVGANGELKEASLRGEGIKGLFGNFAAAFVIALAFTWLLNRRTRV